MCVFYIYAAVLFVFLLVTFRLFVLLDTFLAVRQRMNTVNVVVSSNLNSVTLLRVDCLSGAA